MLSFLASPILALLVVEIWATHLAAAAESASRLIATDRH